ncbi:MAG: signal peptide peptidase SppA, partial [Enterobacteriaceae bacterium]
MRILWKIISSPFYWLWRTLSFIKECILNLLVLFVIITVIWSYMQLQPKNTEPAKSALLIDLMGSVVDNPNEQNRLSRLGQQMFGEPDPRNYENSLFQLVDSIRAAKTDNNITGIILKLNNFTGADQPALNYMGKALREFRDSGKPIYAVGYSYSQ